MSKSVRWKNTFNTCLKNLFLCNIGGNRAVERLSIMKSRSKIKFLLFTFSLGHKGQAFVPLRQFYSVLSRNSAVHTMCSNSDVISTYVTLLFNRSPILSVLASQTVLCVLFECFKCFSLCNNRYF